MDKMDKQNVKYKYNGILFSLKKERNTCNNMHELKDIMLSEISQSQKDKYCTIPLIRGTWNSQILRDIK